MLSTTTWVVILLAAIVLKYAFLVPKEDKEVYKLYEQRDKIAVLAMEGELDQESREYIFVIRYINFWIYYTRHDYDFSIVWHNIVSRDCWIREQEKLLNKIKKSDILYDAMFIASSQGKRALGMSGVVFEKLFLNATIAALWFVVSVLKSVARMITLGKRIPDKPKDYLNDSKTIKRNYKEFNALMNYRG